MNYFMHKLLGAKVNKAAERKEPTWRARLQKRLKTLSQLSQLESSKDKEVTIIRHWQKEKTVLE